tara:strand:- start:246 stop:440 length:195 start_codon:yes stop_codon:yes gene_type:complete
MNKKSQWEDLPDLVTVSEVALYLRVAHATVYKMIRQKKFKAFQIGNNAKAIWRIPKSEIEKLIS